MYFLMLIACFCFTRNFLCTVYLAFIFNFYVIDVRLLHVFINKRIYLLAVHCFVPDDDITVA